MSNEVPLSEWADKEYVAWMKRIQMSTGQERRDYLSQKANWTPLMIHIHRVGMIAGLVFGLIMGLIIGYGLMA